MYSYLPEGNFAWLSEEEIKKFDVFRYAEESNVGFFVEVDLNYTEEIHELTSNLPLAPEHLTERYEVLSPYPKKLCDKFDLKHTLPTRK